MLNAADENEPGEGKYWEFPEGPGRTASDAWESDRPGVAWRTFSMK